MSLPKWRTTLVRNTLVLTLVLSSILVLHQKRGRTDTPTQSRCFYRARSGRLLSENTPRAREHTSCQPSELLHGLEKWPQNLHLQQEGAKELFLDAPNFVTSSLSIARLMWTLT